MTVHRALILEAFRWALGIGALLFVLYLLVRFVKWAWTDKPTEQHGETQSTTEQWGELLDAATGHTRDGRPICQKCGVPIAQGKASLLTDGEKGALAQRRGVESLPGAFQHMDEAECSKPT